VHILRPTCIACALRPVIGLQALVLSGMHWRQSTRDGSSFAASHLSLQQIKVDVDKLPRNKTSRTIICVIGRCTCWLNASDAHQRNADEDVVTVRLRYSHTTESGGGKGTDYSAGLSGDGKMFSSGSAGSHRWNNTFRITFCLADTSFQKAGWRMLTLMRSGVRFTPTQSSFTRYILWI